MDAVRSVSLSGATGSPDTPLSLRYCANGTGDSVVVGDAVVVVVQID
jgi:hypothetical protein